MSLLNLLCPHCGGHFDLDSDRPLQSFWVCPYCGNRSLLQKHDGTIRLRGIIPGRAQTSAQPPAISSRDYSFSVEPELQKQESVQDEIDNRPDFMPPLAQQTRPLEEIIAEVSGDQPEELNTSASSQQQLADVSVNRLDRLCKLADEAARNHDLPLFNVYSRQALDIDPTDPRMYILRSNLAEEADAFARATWASLGWSLLTPRRKTALVAQQLYNLNTALKYSRKEQHPDIIRHFARQLVRQAIDHFTEQGQLRCQRRPFFKTFRGRFTRKDIQMSYCFLDALRLINRQTCPLAYEELLEALRLETSQAPCRIARRLRKL